MLQGKTKTRLKAFYALRRVKILKFALAVPLKLRIYIIRHLFEVYQLLCTNVAYTGNAYWVFEPLGLPAQKGWEIYSPLPGSHHPRLSEKFVTVSVFIDAFVFEVYQPLCTYVAYTGHPISQNGFSSIRLGRE